MSSSFIFETLNSENPVVHPQTPEPHILGFRGYIDKIEGIKQAINPEVYCAHINSFRLKNKMN